jgi:hypothetical protein
MDLGTWTSTAAQPSVEGIAAKRSESNCATLRGV